MDASTFSPRNVVAVLIPLVLVAITASLTVAWADDLPQPPTIVPQSEQVPGYQEYRNYLTVYGNDCDLAEEACASVQEWFSEEACENAATVIGDAYDTTCTVVSSSEGSCPNCTPDPVGEYCHFECEDALPSVVITSKDQLVDLLSSSLGEPEGEGVWMIGGDVQPASEEPSPICGELENPCSPIGSTCWVPLGGAGNVYGLYICL